MNTWPKDELRQIAESDDLHIAPFRENGRTYGTLTWIWSVVVDGELYARGYNGEKSRWYQAAIRLKAGRYRKNHPEGLRTPRCKSANSVRVLRFQPFLLAAWAMERPATSLTGHR